MLVLVELFLLLMKVLMVKIVGLLVVAHLMVEGVKEFLLLMLGLRMDFILLDT